jgi:hypothetical protein
MSQCEAAYKTVRVAGEMDQRVQLVDGLTISIPSELSPGDEQGIDSAVRTWSGGGITVLVDAGPMSDQLGHGESQSLSGHAARVAAFDDAGEHVIAAHIDDPPVTVSVRFARAEQEGVARGIIESLTD